MTWEGSWGRGGGEGRQGEKEKLLCCFPADKIKHCQALPGKPKQSSGTSFALELELSAAPGFPLPWGFVLFQVVVLVTVGFFLSCFVLFL